MSDQDPSSVREWPIQDTVVKEMMPNICIDCTERIIQQDNFAFIVSCSGDTYPLPLSTRKSDTTLTD
jgi:hypothetical protein